VDGARHRTREKGRVFEALIRRLRTLTIGFLTPFYFIRAGYLVSILAVIAAPAAFAFFLLTVKAATKIISVYPVARYFGQPHKNAMYTTLLMSTGLTFGTIASLFGLSHGVIDTSQYSRWRRPSSGPPSFRR